MKNITVITFRLLNAICLKHLSASNADSYAKDVIDNINTLGISLTMLLTYLNSKQVESLEELYYTLKDIEYNDYLKRR